MKINAKITISRNSNDRICIRLKDESSSIEFFDGEISLEDFAKAVTGQGFVPCPAEVRGLENVGKSRERKKTSIICPLGWASSKDELTEWLIANGGESGWTVDPYLGSQGSIAQEDGNRMRINYSLYRFVTQPQPPAEPVKQPPQP